MLGDLRVNRCEEDAWTEIKLIVLIRAYQAPPHTPLPPPRLGAPVLGTLVLAAH